jgi:hypothetical protein
MGSELVIRFNERLQNVTTNNYDSLTELHTPKITVTTAYIKSSQFAMSSPVVAWWQIPTMSSTSMLTFLLASNCLTTNSALLHNDLQQWGLLHLPRLHQGRMSAATSNGSVSQLLTADSQLLTSESELLCDWWFTADQFVLAPSPLRLTTRDFFLQLNPYSHSPYITSPLMRGWVCLL